MDQVIRESEEKHFRDLCFDLLDNRLERWKIKSEDLEDSIKKLIESFKYEEGNHFSDFDLDERENACAYLNRFGPLHTALVRYRIIQAISNCKVLKQKIKQPTLHILDIGCGPGMDVVGFCSALSEFDMSQCKALNFTFLDCVDRWVIFINIMWEIVRNKDFGKASDLLTKFGNEDVEFMKEDFSERPSTDLVRALSSADILLVPRLLSIVSDPQSILKVIYDSMWNDALLIVIDSPNIKVGSKCCRLESVIEGAGFQCLYQSHDELFQITPPRPSEYREMLGAKYLRGVGRKTNAEVFVLQKKCDNAISRYNTSGIPLPWSPIS